jgi:hypothetical protein
MSSPVNEIESHILSMYNPSSVPSQVNYSLQYLLKVAESPDFLPLALPLLTRESDYVLYWTSNTLMTRIRRDAKQLHEREMDADILYSKVRDCLSIYVEEKRKLNVSVVDRLSWALSYLSMLHGNEKRVHVYIHDALSLLSSSMNSHSSMMISLTLLSTIAEAINSLRDASTIDFLCLRHPILLNQMMDTSSSVIDVCTHLLTTPASPLIHPSSPTSSAIKEGIFKLLR